MKREAVAKLIIGLAQEHSDLDAATLHRKTVAAFGDPSNDGEPQHEPDLERSAFRLTHILSSSDSWRILVVEWP